MSQPVGSSTSSSPVGRRSALRWALTLDSVALVSLAAGMALILGQREETPSGFWADMPASALMLVAALLPVAAAVVAAVSLWRDRLTSREGVWAIRLTIFAAVFLPVLGTIQGISELAGHRLPTGWGQPLVPIWLLAMVAVAVLGVRAPDPHRRGLLVIPLVFGAAVLAFVTGDIISP